MRVIKMIMIVSILLSSLFVKVSANNEDYGSLKDITYEKRMPLVRNEFSINIWKSETKMYLENFYQSEVIEIQEDSNAIYFIFKDKEVLDEEFIKKVTYFKNLSSRANAGDYKKEELVTFSNIYNKNSASAANWNVAKTTFITIFGVVYTIQGVVLSLANMVVDYLNQFKRIDVQDQEQYKYTRKVGYVYNNSGFWQPTAYVGDKETSTRQTINYYSNTDYATTKITNWQFRNYEKKSNFTDDSWLRSKAFESYNNGSVYYDCFNY